MKTDLERVRAIRDALGWDLTHCVALARGEASVAEGTDLLAAIQQSIAPTDEAYTRGRLEGYREGVEAIKDALMSAGAEVVEVEGVEA